MNNFEKVAIDNFSEIIINKGLIHEAGFGSRAIPKYVGEWIISHYNDDDIKLSEESRKSIAKFIDKYVPPKGAKESIKNQLLEQEEVQLLDNFSVLVNLVKGDRYLNIPFLDEHSAFIAPQVVQDNQMLFSSGLWGVGTLFYIPPSDENPKGQVWMKELKPFQIANLDLDYFVDSRKHFTTQEWIDLLISSMGFNHEIYGEREKIWLISRLIPMVEPRYNLVELAPKGTGKSFVYDNMSRYVAVRSGSISPAVLFYNDARKTPGLITRYDCVVIDEAQKVKTDSSGELTALLKSYLESGKFGRGASGVINAEAGIILLANIEIDDKRMPLNEEIGLFRNFPNFLTETAFVDRFSGLLPGWALPRITNNTPSKSLGLKGDIFGELLHLLRNDISFKDYIKSNMQLDGCDDMRDSKAIEAGAAALLKLIFPDKAPSDEEFYQYCVNPAVELRQRVRDELCKMDREYSPATIKSKFPDDYQRHHKKPIFYDPTKFAEMLLKVEDDKNDNNIDEQIEEEEIQIPVEKNIKISDGDIGYSFVSLFKPYLSGAKKIKIVDPYIRYDYQIKNLVSFLNVVVPGEGYIEVELVTASDDEFGKGEQEKKFGELQNNLVRHGIKFEFSFDNKIHDRVIESDNGWKIILGRGLDIFIKSEGKFD
ncbi:MAG: BREX system Lon protease-like protein BrxL, partial [Ignavibacteriae bacterium]|nr:BREX system Lon protease-like protein BrxL [Ignavibacteriota bacterium]